MDRIAEFRNLPQSSAELRRSPFEFCRGLLKRCRILYFLERRQCRRLAAGAWGPRRRFCARLRGWRPPWRRRGPRAAVQCGPARFAATGASQLILTRSEIRGDRAASKLRSQRCSALRSQLCEKRLSPARLAWFFFVCFLLPVSGGRGGCRVQLPALQQASVRLVVQSVNCATRSCVVALTTLLTRRSLFSCYFSFFLPFRFECFSSTTYSFHEVRIFPGTFQSIARDFANAW
jgi:hypothetical protein